VASTRTVVVCARPVGTEEAEDLPGLHLEGQVLEGDTGAEALREAFGDDDRTAAHSSRL